MNTYQKLSRLKDELFRRKTGVKRKTFNRMIEILKEAEIEKKKLGGKPNKQSHGDYGFQERVVLGDTACPRLVQVSPQDDPSC